MINPSESVESAPAPTMVPAIANSPRWHGLIGVLAWGALAVAVIMAVVAFFIPMLPGTDGGAALVNPLRGVLGLCSAVALVVSAGVLPAWLIVGGRVRVAEAIEAARLTGQLAAQARALAQARTDDANVSDKPLFASSNSESALLLSDERARLVVLAGWPQALIAGPLALLAAALAWWFFPHATSATGDFAIGVGLVIAAFPVLILERRFTLATVAELPESVGIARLLRLLLWVLVGIGVGTVLLSFGIGLALWIEWALAVLVIAVAGELFLRALALPFLPVSSAETAKASCDSVIAGLFLSRLDPVQGLGGGLKERFGIDLSQSWALRFVRRAAPSLIAVLGLVAWLLTGITVLDVSERGVYERFGSPATVLRAGIHAHLPWPFGIVRRVDDGAVHELVLASDDGEAVKAIVPTASDEEPAAIFDRLWTQEHTSETFYAVPSLSSAPVSAPTTNSGQQRGFQVINGDLRVFYRVGLDDESARNSLYRLATPESAIRFFGARIITRMLSTRALFQIIADDREALDRSVREALQHELDLSASGLEITSVAITSTHPPVAAAFAYHGVQAAEISAFTDIAVAKRRAAQDANEAARAAAVTRDGGSANAAEWVAKAHAEHTRFSADVQAMAAAPVALPLERWLQTLGRDLAKGQLTIIDHRLSSAHGATIDLRRFAPAAAMPTATDKGK